MDAPRTTLPRRLALLAGLVLSLLVSACGVRPENEPDIVPTTRSPSATAAPGDVEAGREVVVYFVRGADLTPVRRRASSVVTSTALALLVEGPTRAEAASGIRTALPPEVVGVDLDLADAIATVTVTRGFAGITGGNQLLAVAQVVWTLTEMPQVTAVRFILGERPVEVPTDAGLTDRPVRRADYMSVTPLEPPREETPPGETPATDQPPTSSGSAPTG